MFNKISRGIRRVLAIALSSVMVLSTPIVSLADITEEEIIVENVQEPASEITQELDTVDVAEEPATEEVMQAPVSDEIITSSEIEAEPGIIEVSSPSEVIEEAEEIAATPSEIILEDTAEDGMKITLKADPDAFEYIEGLSLDVSVVSEKAAKEADEELESETKNDNIAKRVTYDIRVMHGGVEIEPHEGKKVQVRFTMTDIPSGADSVNVYHIDEEDGVETIVDEAPVNEAATSEIENGCTISNESESIRNDSKPDTEYEEDGLIEDGDITDDVTIIGETGSFSLYTVDFTYKEKTISIPGDTTENLLSDILTEVGIEGEIAEAKAYQDASCSQLAENGEVKDGDKVLFRVYQKDDEWYVDAVNAFHTEHGLKVTMNEGAEYIIKVTDNTAPKIDDLEFVADDFTYDGFGKVAKFKGKEGMGTITVKYATAITGEWSENIPVDANKYYVKAVIAEGKEYSSAELTSNGWCFTINKRSITLTSASASKEYDGTPLTKNEVTVSGDGFASDEGATYDVTGSQTLAGISKNIFTYTLNDGTKADNYEITTAEGDLTVNKVPTAIIITAASDTKIYDGTALTNSGYTYTDNVLVDGDILNVEISGSITDSGTTPNRIKESCKVMRGEVDVTGCYTFGNFINGTLTVNKRNVTLTSGSATKVYDGTPLVNKEVAVSDDGFASGEGAEYTVVGSQMQVGSSANIFTYELNSDTNPSNYNISKIEGVLTVTEKPTLSPGQGSTPIKEEKIIVPIGDGDTIVGEAKVEGNKAIISDFTPETVEKLVTGKNVPETLTIDCSNTGSIITEVELDTANIQTVAESNTKNLKVAMNSGSIVLDKGALTTVADKAESNAIVFGVERISDTKLNTKQKNAVNTELASRQNANVFAIVDSYILANKSRINDLENGKATLEINSNFAPGTAEIVKNGNVGVYEIPEDGTLKKVDSKTADGNIEFEANNLTLSVILVD